MSVRFQYLFEPIKVKNIIIPNRIVSMPHSTRFGAEGLVTERMIAYQTGKGKGWRRADCNRSPIYPPFFPASLRDDP